MKYEKAIAAALEPLVDVIVRIEARLKALEVPQQIEVPIDDVAAALKADPEFCEMVKGAPGVNGETPQVNHELIAQQIAETIEPPRDGKDGEPGTNGKDGDNGRDGIDGVGHNVKEWAPGVYREGALVQHDMGRIARAKRDTAEQPGSGNDWERIGLGGFRWRGVKSDTAYEHGDFYIDDGTTFLVLDGKAHMFCRKGRNGKDGEPGANGKDGENGRDGKDASALIGEMKIWPGAEVPDGFLLLDGSRIPDGEQYDALRAMHGDHVPDWSSEFLVSETKDGTWIAVLIVRAYVA